MEKKKKINYLPGFIVIVAVLLIISIITIVSAPDSYFQSLNSKTKSSSSYSKYLDLSLRNVSLSKTKYSNYYTCSGSIYVSSSSSYKYRYVKVKIKYLDYYGNVVDTGWTYAIDSTYLEPGESKTWDDMVSANYNISKCTAEIQYDD